MRYTRISIISMILFSWLLLIESALADPTRPKVDVTLTPEKETEIASLRELNVQEVFEVIKQDKFFVDKDFMNKAIFVSFRSREMEAVHYSMNQLAQPSSIVEGETATVNKDFFVAKRVLRVFPEHSVPLLLGRYAQATDPVLQVNIIHVIGNMEGGQNLQDVLVASLDNKAFWEEEYPELSGALLRICDEAYNQLVLRYRMKNVLRTIGNDYPLEVRDYHIEILKEKF